MCYWAGLKVRRHLMQNGYQMAPSDTIRVVAEARREKSQFNETLSLLESWVM